MSHKKKKKKKILKMSIKQKILEHSGLDTETPIVIFLMFLAR